MSETTTPYETEMSEAGGCRRRLTVRVAADEVARETEEIVHRYAKAVRIPGFRKGHVPPALVRKRFAKEIEEEVREHLVNHGLREAIQQHKVFPLHDPVVEGGELKDGEPFSYTALFETKPELHLGEYTGLAVSLPEPTVTEEDVDKAVDQVRESLARFVAVAPRPLAQGDFAALDLQGHYEDGKGSDFKHEGVLVELGAESNLPEFNEALPGMVPGDTRAFVVSYPAEFGADHLAGRQVRYTVMLREIKTRELPPADDELPKDIGRPGTMQEFREEIRADLLAGRKRSAEGKARDSLVRQLIEKHPVEVPEVMVEEQLNLTMEEIVRGMIMRGIHPSKADVDWKAVREKELPMARQRVLGMLILDEIASREQITVTDAEISRRIAEEASRRGQGAEEARKRLDQDDARQVIKNQLVREKSLDFLMKNATISS